MNATLKVASLEDKLDRNCRILATLDQDIRLHVADSVRSGHASFDHFPDVSC